MGLLSEGNPLSWEETKKHAEHVRQHGIQQFINLYAKLKDRQGDILKWGDEIEYMIVRFDHENKKAQVSLRAEEILQKLNEEEIKNPDGVKSLWRPEYANYMVEGTPGKPYGGLLAHFNVVEANMSNRRHDVAKLLKENEVAMCITSFPMLGMPNFTFPPYAPRPDAEDGVAKSLYFVDEAIFPGHPRFKTLSRNIRMRRGSKVSIDIPVFKDKNTKIPVAGSTPEKPDHIHMDAMGFGMGCCCLQFTFQCCNINEARTLYDQLTPLCPIMLALSAASPIHRGMLSDTDCRWNVISASVDCRTPEERGEKPLKEGQLRIHKSRYDSIDSYLSPAGQKFNDIPLVYHQQNYKKLLEGNIDPLLAQHVAHLFIRDTVSLFSEKVNQNDEEDTDHFENIQSTNWQTMRFKPPPPNTSIGWRVEFRPCELQLTDFENSAFACFIVLLTRVILSYNLDLLIPISKVDENMQNAQKRNACREQKFWFKKSITGVTVDGKNLKLCRNENCEELCNEYELMTIDQIINGKGTFPGLLPLLHSYLASMDVDVNTHCTITQYLHLISQRASGQLMTTASWIREKVTTHPDYKQDSVITDTINYDLLMKCLAVQENLEPCPELLGHSNSTKTSEHVPHAITKHLRAC
ncbi:glutamate--cysteine ligase catalytic subunit [Culicoides brevitarsis]|uniref:glutamate--cysteine ligase catalytic subunit n=1 Tax=Culicoides brevitarsis TaxID=469753 RepID=UPI00307C6C46